MQLPEILEVIFKHLPLYTLASSASLVSKHWNAVSRRHMYFTLRWFLAAPDNKQRDPSQHIGKVDVLYIQFYEDLLSKRCMFPESLSVDSNYDYSWEALSLALSTASMTYTGIRLKKLVLNGDIRYKIRLYPLLPYLHGLIDLRLEKIYDPHVDLKIIFSFCPYLQHLYLEARGNDITGARDRVQLLWLSRQSSAYLGETSNSSVELLYEEQTAGITIGELKLKSLALHGLDFGMTTIEPLLRSCPGVTRVEITQWNQWTEYQSDALKRSSLYAILNESCPQIEHVHIYLVHDKLTERDASDLIDAFHKIHSLTFTTLDLTRPKLCEAIFPSTLSSHLTTLEITQSFETEPIAHILHRILCTTPTLLHLKAPTVRYWAEYMDLEGDVNDNGKYRPLYCIRRTASRLSEPSLKLLHPWITRDIWACRGIRSLRMWIQGAKGDVRDSESARIMFGYLSVVCPELRDIHITRSSVDVTLEGGLCLLMKLKHLKRVEIETDAIPKLTRKDLIWLSSSKKDFECGKKEDFIQQIGRWKTLNDLRSQERKETRYKSTQFRYLPSYKPQQEKLMPARDTTLCGRFEAITFQDVIEATRLASVVRVLEEIETYGNTCWPGLELFALVVSRSGMMYLSRQEIEDTIRKVRSNMEIRSIFSVLDF
ncbi:hypothetical protein BGX27_006004 [Mortierella sp. AM989]|nr:hypothetical protein BGX27_006004 [Mortierella sp. AM989]